ncbi:xylulokinase [Bauldia sp.]|uniref:xylulokinase n=1 Tax=Bauldia sp. TaxID=2575872 RepID=UPI003BABE5EE
MRDRGFLGIDLGTSAVKVVVQDETGTAVAKARVPYETTTPQANWAEQSPEDWWTATCTAVRAVLADLHDSLDIAAVGLSGQLNGFVLLDGDNRPLHDAVIWLDLRATDETARIVASAGARIGAVTGNTLTPIAVLPKLAWFHKHRPELMGRVKRVALVKDMLLLRLTGVLVTDPSDAVSTAMASLVGTRWQPDLCEYAGITPEQMPEIRPSPEIVGTILPAAAEQIGLPPGTPVATGAGDVAALAVGCGAVKAGRVAVTLGTAGHVVADATGHRSPEPGAVWQIPHAVPGHDLWLGLVMSGGLSLAWMRTLLGAGGQASPDYAALEALARQSPPGADGVTFLPFLEGASTPYDRPDARASFHGLNSTHGPGDLVRAVLEGVAFNVRQCVGLFETLGMTVSEVRLAEGGAQLPLWCQIIADTLGTPVQLVEELDTSAAGAAIIARAGARDVPLGELAERLVRMGQSFEPNPETANIIKDAYQCYLALCDRSLAP